MYQKKNNNFLYNNHNINYRTNLKCSFLYKSKFFKKQYNRFKLELLNLKKKKFIKRGYINISLFSYYEYQIKQSFIYLSILNKNFGFIRYKGYQYFYPF